MEDYSEDYHFTVNIKRSSGMKEIHMAKTIKITSVYDDKGYMHRYVIKEFLDEVLAGLQAFDKDVKKTPKK